MWLIRPIWNNEAKPFSFLLGLGASIQFAQFFRTTTDLLDNAVCLGKVRFSKNSAISLSLLAFLGHAVPANNSNPAKQAEPAAVRYRFERIFAFDGHLCF